MRKVISVFLPHWPMNLERRRVLHRDRSAWQPAKPFVIATTEGRTRDVVAVNAAASARGLAPGMSIFHARAVAPDLKAASARPLADARALQKLAVRMLRYSPLVAACPPDGLWIDATGCTHLFGGEAKMLAGITRRLKALGFQARVAMAPSPGAAWAWARYGTHDPVLCDRALLDPLPLRALRLSEGAVHALRHIGLKTIGDLKHIPRATIPVRFGPEVLLRLDQALGHAGETINALAPPAARQKRLAFAEPIATPEDLARCILHLTQALCADLDKTCDGARRFDLVFTRVDGETPSLRIATAAASRNAVHIAKLFTEKLSGVDPGFGIEAAILTAWRVSSLTPAQLATDGTTSTARDLGELVDRLSARVGARNVYKVAAVESDLPERAAVPADPMQPAIQEWPAHLPRPTRLLTPPEPVQVIALLPDYPPAKFRWHGRLHSVRSADGPERVFGEWWQNPREVGEQRDYFRVENETGERYWLFRISRPDQDSTWFVHGVFA